MIKQRKKQVELVEQYNPFNVNINSDLLIKNLDDIDNASIRYKYKGTQDPIFYAFESIESMPLKVLAKDFVREGICDFIDFISKICK